MSGQSDEWNRVDTPVSSTIHDVVGAGGTAVAVGSGGLVLVRTEGVWRLAAKNGPNASGDTLYGVAATDNGRRVWLSGSSGSLGFYDTKKGVIVDYSAPRGMTGTWKGVTVSGTAESEAVYLADDSGNVLAGRLEGQKANWDVQDDGDGDGLDGASIHVLVERDGAVFAGNSNGDLYRTGKKRWEQIGIDLQSSTLHDVLVGSGGAVTVDSSGRAFRYVNGSWKWQKIAQGPLYGLARLPGETFTVGASGRALRRPDGGSWTGVDVPTSKPLYATTTLGDRAIIVGGSGRILERPLERPRSNVSTAESPKSETTESVDEKATGKTLPDDGSNTETPSQPPSGGATDEPPKRSTPDRVRDVETGETTEQPGEQSTSNPSSPAASEASASKPETPKTPNAASAVESSADSASEESEKSTDSSPNSWL